MKNIETLCHAPFQRKGGKKKGLHSCNNTYEQVLHEVVRGRAHDLGNRFIHNEATRNEF